MKCRHRQLPLSRAYTYVFGLKSVFQIQIQLKSRFHILSQDENRNSDFKSGFNPDYDIFNLLILKIYLFCPMKLLKIYFVRNLRRTFRPQFHWLRPQYLLFCDSFYNYYKLNQER